MNLPFPLFPRTKEDMYFFAYGAAVMALISMFLLVELYWIVNGGMRTMVLDSLQNATVNVQFEGVG